MEILKHIELDIFKNYIYICEKYKLRYYILGGTALGAVRHKGFIPWDDDIDVGMPRYDYEKFLEVAPKELPEYLFLQTNITDKNYPLNFAKIRNSNTSFIETRTQNIKMNHGIYIDVFPLDGYPSFKAIAKMRQTLDIVISKSIKNIFFYEKHIKKTLAGHINDIISHVFFKDYRKAVKLRDKLLKKYDYEKCDIVANYCGAWGLKEVMPKSYFGNGTIGEFEGLKVMLPYDYDKYLTSLYGDYMTPPPPEKRISHHYCTVIDTNKSYLNYIDKENNNEKSNYIRDI